MHSSSFTRDANFVVFSKKPCRSNPSVLRQPLYCLGRGYRHRRKTAFSAREILLWLNLVIDAPWRNRSDPVVWHCTVPFLTILDHFRQKRGVKIVSLSGQLYDSRWSRIRVDEIPEIKDRFKERINWDWNREKYQWKRDTEGVDIRSPATPTFIPLKISINIGMDGSKFHMI